MDMFAVIGRYQHKSMYEGEGREAECIYKTLNAVYLKEGLSSWSQAVGGALRGPFASTSILVFQVCLEGKDTEKESHTRADVGTFGDGESYLGRVSGSVCFHGVARATRYPR